MTVLKVVGVLLGITLLIVSLEGYVNEKYNRSILDLGSIVVLALVEFGFIILVLIECEDELEKQIFT
jgi:hypothetical protein